MSRKKTSGGGGRFTLYQLFSAFVGLFIFSARRRILVRKCFATNVSLTCWKNSHGGNRHQASKGYSPQKPIVRVNWLTHRQVSAVRCDKPPPPSVCRALVDWPSSGLPTHGR